MGGGSSKARGRRGSSAHTGSRGSPPAPVGRGGVSAGATRAAKPAPAPALRSPLEDFIASTGVYPGECNFPRAHVRSSILAGTLAPRWPPVDEDAAPEDVELEECPVCFNGYAGPLNATACCRQAICSECFLFVQTPAAAKPCPFCQGDSFAVAFAGCKHSHMTAVRTAAAAGAAAASAAAAAGSPALRPGTAVSTPSPVLTASVAQRQALEASIAAESQDSVAQAMAAAGSSGGGSVSLGSTGRRRRQERPRWMDMGGREGGAEHPPRSLRDLMSAVRDDGRRLARRGREGEERPARGDSDRFARYQGGGRRGGRGVGGSRRGSPRGAPPAALGMSGEDLDLVERLMMLQAMRASLAEAGGGEAPAGAGGGDAPPEAEGGATSALLEALTGALAPLQGTQRAVARSPVRAGSPLGEAPAAPALAQAGSAGSAALVSPMLTPRGTRPAAGSGDWDGSSGGSGSPGDGFQL